MADRGRPARGVETSNVLLRIPATLLEQVDVFKDTLESERGGFRINRTDVLTRLIEVGLQTLTQARQPIPQPAPASHTNGKLAPAPSVTMPQAAETPEPAALTMPATRTRAVPKHIQTIAEFAAQYDKLSLADLGQLLFERKVYRAKDRKTGEEKPVNRGTLGKWLEQAREAGVL